MADPPSPSLHLAKIFWKILRVSRIFGMNPIKFRKITKNSEEEASENKLFEDVPKNDDNRADVYFEFRWLSRLTSVSILWLSIYVPALLYMIYRMVIGDYSLSKARG